MPRLAPWGESISINALTVGRSEDDASHIAQIQMQSEDVITIQAQAFKLD